MRKYIPQATYENFIYPNNNVAIYDNNDVVQNINSNEITGTTSGFTASLSGTTLTVSFNYTWNKNGGEVFRNQADRLHLFSVHMMTPAKKYFNPWRLIDYKYVTGTTLNSYTGSFTTSITQSTFGETFTSGEYSFEIRFIGGLNTYIICQNYTIAGPLTPTPTPTTTPGLTPTPTPTHTPSATVPLVYYVFNVTAGYPSSAAACLDGTPITQIFGALSVFLDNSLFYTTAYLSTPYAGNSLFYQNTALGQWVQIDNSGNNIAEGSC